MLSNYRHIKDHHRKILELSVLIFTYALSRYIFWKLGLVFDATNVPKTWQYLDTHWLTQNLFSSIYYLHSQPPIFNLFVGGIFKIFPDHFSPVFHLFFLLFGFLAYLCLFEILRNLNFKALTSFIIATAYIISPEALIFENRLFYTWPVTSLLLLSVFGFIRYERTKLIRYAVLSITTLTIICLTRSMFHLVFLLAAVLLLNFIPAPDKKKLRVLFICSVSAVLLLYTKNLVVFDFFGSSSWMGMNMWRIAAYNKTSGAEEIAKEKSLMLGNSFSGIGDYPREMTVIPEKYSHIDSLTFKTKLNGSPNFNHYGYINISKEYRQASTQVILNNIPAYIDSLKVAWDFYCIPPWLIPTRKMPEAIKSYIYAYSLFEVRKRIENRIIGKHPISLYSSAWAIPIAMFFTTLFVILIFTKRNNGTKYTCAFMLGTILYVFILGNMIELYENNRFRIMTNPLLLILMVTAIRHLQPSRRDKTSENTGHPED